MFLSFRSHFSDFAQNLEHNFVWCQNRKWLTNSSNADRLMVYRKFYVEARQPFGAYARCNPDPKTGKSAHKQSPPLLAIYG